MSITQLKDATQVLTIAIQSMLPELMTSLASWANVKWSKLLINGVLTSVSNDIPAHSSAECQHVLTLDNPSYGHLTITQLSSWVCSPPSTSLAHTHPLLLLLRTLIGRLLLVSSLPSSFTFLVCRLLLRDGSKSCASGNKASRVKGVAVSRLYLWV